MELQVAIALADSVPIARLRQQPGPRRPPLFPLYPLPFAQLIIVPAGYR